MTMGSRAIYSCSTCGYQRKFFEKPKAKRAYNYLRENGILDILKARLMQSAVLLQL